MRLPFTNDAQIQNQCEQECNAKNDIDNLRSVHHDMSRIKSKNEKQQEPFHLLINNEQNLHTPVADATLTSE